MTDNWTPNRRGFQARNKPQALVAKEQGKELRYLAMDIKLFLRMAATHFPATKDRAVIERLMDLADQYGAEQCVWQKQEE